MPFVPSEQEIDALIAACGKKTSTFLQLLKETGARPGEAFALKWTDIDFEGRIVTINDPEKNSYPRTIKVSGKPLAMINQLPKRNCYIFRANPNSIFRKFARNFYKKRLTLASKLQNPRIRRISFKTFRHWKATMEYHRTKDILHVKELLGHVNIQNTLVYTHLVHFENDNFICKTASSLEEATSLIESGFDYVTEMDDFKIFRKPK